MKYKKKSNDYKKELVYHKNKIKLISNGVDNRLKTLIREYPNLIVGTVKVDGETTEFKAKTTLTDQYLSNLDTAKKIEYIEIFEKYITSLEKSKQLELEFN